MLRPRVPLAADASQVPTNVLLNTLAWAPRDSRITVEPRLEEASVAIIVADEGPGIAPDQVATVFDGVTRRDEGAGVGLKYARAMARVRQEGISSSCRTKRGRAPGSF